MLLQMHLPSVSSCLHARLLTALLCNNRGSLTLANQFQDVSPEQHAFFHKHQEACQQEKLQQLKTCTRCHKQFDSQHPDGCMHHPGSMNFVQLNEGTQHERYIFDHYDCCHKTVLNTPGIVNVATLVTPGVRVCCSICLGLDRHFIAKWRLSGCWTIWCVCLHTRPAAIQQYTWEAAMSHTYVHNALSILLCAALEHLPACPGCRSGGHVSQATDTKPFPVADQVWEQACTRCCGKTLRDVPGCKPTSHESTRPDVLFAQDEATHIFYVHRLMTTVAQYVRYCPASADLTPSLFPHPVCPYKYWEVFLY